jgi:hypothetical protein
MTPHLGEWQHCAGFLNCVIWLVKAASPGGLVAPPQCSLVVWAMSHRGNLVLHADTSAYQGAHCLAVSASCILAAWSCTFNAVG